MSCLCRNGRPFAIKVTRDHFVMIWLLRRIARDNVQILAHESAIVLNAASLGRYSNTACTLCSTKDSPALCGILTCGNVSYGGEQLHAHFDYYLSAVNSLDRCQQVCCVLATPWSNPIGGVPAEAIVQEWQTYFFEAASCSTQASSSSVNCYRSASGGELVSLSQVPFGYSRHLIFRAASNHRWENQTVATLLRVISRRT